MGKKSRKNRFIIRFETVRRVKCWNPRLALNVTEVFDGFCTITSNTKLGISMCLFFFQCAQVNLPNEHPLSLGRSHKHQKQPETSHLVFESGPFQSHKCVRHQFFYFLPIIRWQVDCSHTAELPHSTDNLTALQSMEKVICSDKVCWLSFILSVQYSAADSGTFSHSVP